MWDRRKNYKFDEFSWKKIGIVPIFLSIGIILTGEIGSVETLLFLGIWGCMVSLTFIYYGWRIRHLTFPLIILFFVIPLPPFINNILTFRLKIAASTLSVYMFRATGVSVFQEGNVIDIGISQLQVVDACSGLRYLMPLLLMALLMGYFYSKGFWRKTILVVVAIPISVVLNALRVYVTGLLYINGKSEFAESLFHDFTGWLIFMIAGVLLYMTSLILRRIGGYQRFKGDQAEDPGDHVTCLTRPVVLTTIICIMFITSGWALREIPYASNFPQRSAFKLFPMKLGEWQGIRNYLAREIIDQLWADDYVSVVYTNSNNGNAIYLFIPFYEYQGTRHTAHAPQACLLGSGFALLDQRERPVNLNNGNQINVMTMTLERGGDKVLGSYFFLQRGRVITNPWMNKFYLMWDAFTKRRTDGALVRAEMILAPSQTIEEAYPILEDFIAELWQILSDYVPS